MLGEWGFKNVVWYCYGYESRAMKSLCSGVWSRIIAINISRTGIPRSVSVLFIKRNIIFEDWLRSFLGFFVGFCGRLEMGIGSLLERTRLLTRLLVVLDHLSPELIAGLNAQGIT